MSHSYSSLSRHVRLTSRLARKLAVRSLLSQLALIAIMFACSVATAATLGLDTHWSGQGDTFNGMFPVSTQNATSVPDSYPELAAGFDPYWFATGTALHLATNQNYGRWPQNGDFDAANEVNLGGFASRGFSLGTTGL